MYEDMWNNNSGHIENKKTGMGKKIELNTRQGFVFL